MNLKSAAAAAAAVAKMNYHQNMCDAIDAISLLALRPVFVIFVLNMYSAFRDRKQRIFSNNMAHINIVCFFLLDEMNFSAHRAPSIDTTQISSILSLNYKFTFIDLTTVTWRFSCDIP